MHVCMHGLGIFIVQVYLLNSFTNPILPCKLSLGVFVQFNFQPSFTLQALSWYICLIQFGINGVRMNRVFTVDPFTRSSYKGSCGRVLVSVTSISGILLWTNQYIPKLNTIILCNFCLEG